MDPVEEVDTFDDDLDFDIDPEDIYFYLFLRGGNINRPTRVRLEDIANLNINNRIDLKVIIHGWTESLSSFWYRPTIEAYFNSKDVTLIALDWNEHALANYIRSVRAIQKIGEIIGEFLVRMNRFQNIPYENMHVIGHSLGAHMSGFTGNKDCYHII